MGEEIDSESAEIEEEDRIFTAHILPEDQWYFIQATKTISQHLAAAFSKNSNTASFCDTVPESLHDFEDIFNKESFDNLPEQCKCDHTIELECQPSPGFCKCYPMSLEEQAELNTFLEEALSMGRICPSKSPIDAPVFFINKKDSKLHFIQDYHALNAIM
jgi:hypothetical protein